MKVRNKELLKGDWWQVGATFRGAKLRLLPLDLTDSEVFIDVFALSSKEQAQKQLDKVHETINKKILEYKSLAEKRKDIL